MLKIFVSLFLIVCSCTNTSRIEDFSVGDNSVDEKKEKILSPSVPTPKNSSIDRGSKSKHPEQTSPGGVDDGENEEEYERCRGYNSDLQGSRRPNEREMTSERPTVGESFIGELEGYLNANNFGGVQDLFARISRTDQRSQRYEDWEKAITMLNNVANRNGGVIEKTINEAHVLSVALEDPVDALPEPSAAFFSSVDPKESPKSILLSLFDRINFYDPNSLPYFSPNTRIEDSYVKDIEEIKSRLGNFYDNVNQPRERKIIHLSIERLACSESSADEYLKYQQVLDFGLAGYHCETRKKGEIDKALSYLTKNNEDQNSHSLEKSIEKFLIDLREKVVLETFRTPQNRSVWENESTHVKGYWLQLLGDQVGLPHYPPYHTTDPGACRRGGYIAVNCYPYWTDYYLGDNRTLGQTDYSQIKPVAKFYFYQEYTLKKVVDAIYNLGSSFNKLQTYGENHNLIPRDSNTVSYEEIYEDNYEHFKKEYIEKVLFHIGGYIKYTYKG